MKLYTGIMEVIVIDDVGVLAETLENLKEGEERVLDLRSVSEEALAVKVVVEALTTRPDTVGQLWIPNLQKKFKEFVSRFEKRLETKGLVSRTLMLSPDVELEECFTLGKRLATMYEVLSGLGNLVSAHPVFEHHTQGAMVIIETRAAKSRKVAMDGNAEDVEVVESVDSQVQPDRKEIKRRRPHEKTFRKVRKFLREATENAENVDRLAKSGNPVDDKCFLCMKCEPFVLRRGLCEACTQLNQRMIEVKTNLTGKFAIVTGGRIKIGFHTAVRLLRDGCFVIVTTRFPVNGWKVYSELADFVSWKHRLRILALDLQDLANINKFLEDVKTTIPHLDILINNAAQTLSRPKAFYNYLHMEAQGVLTGPKDTSLKEVCPNLPPDYWPSLAMEPPNGEKAANMSDEVEPDLETVGHNGKESYQPPVKQSRQETGVIHTNQPGQIALNSTSRFFPVGLLDEEGQQVDLRSRNSWTHGLQEVPLGELLETLTINSVAPFLLISKLMSLLQKSPHARKFIVNVSAMEGQFGRASKGCKHPHTNMAKAALNMLTRTSGLELQLDNIYMTAVDTGWCTDERPHATHYGEERHQECVKGFQVPLSHEDGAARVYHPVWQGLEEEHTQPYFAVFLKNFKPHPW